MTATPATHNGKCFCGAVEITVTGEPVGMGYCHCSSCRSWSAGPVNAFTIWPMEAVQVTAGAEHLASYAKTPRSKRQFCTKCGGHVMTEHPGYMDVYAATIPDLPFVPALHVHYAETVLPMQDGLPKYKNTPAPGGSGELIAE